MSFTDPIITRKVIGSNPLNLNEHLLTLRLTEANI
jgi:hypothetical protein